VTYVPVATVVNFNTNHVVVPPVPFPGIPFNIDGFEPPVASTQASTRPGRSQM
jgi:hypothetical protein